MAGDWIKVRTDLQSHPKIVRILSATGSDKFRVIGGLHAVWSVFDAHSTDGTLRGYTPDLLDHVIGWNGFSRAMEAVGWLLFDGLETLALPEFDAHNGQSAKRRAEDQKRKKIERNRPQSVRILSADNSDKMRTREREEIEEKKQQQLCASGEAPAPAKSDPIPYQSIVDCYNRTMTGLAKVQVTSAKRKAAMRSVWAASPRFQSLKFFEAFFAECQESSFLNGTGPYANGHENWRPDFDYLMQTKVVTKVYERAMQEVEAEAHASH